jgi:hypothetical protein
MSLLILTSACETSTDTLFGTGGGGGSVTQAEVAGNWSFTLTKTTTLACTGGALSNGQVITTQMDVGSDGTLNTATSVWEDPPDNLAHPLSGAIRFTDGVADLILPVSPGSGSAMELRGTFSANSSFSGTLTDPAAGFTPVFGTSGCEYTASGTKA